MLFGEQSQNQYRLDSTLTFPPPSIKLFSLFLIRQILSCFYISKSKIQKIRQEEETCFCLACLSQLAFFHTYRRLVTGRKLQCQRGFYSLVKFKSWETRESNKRSMKKSMLFHEDLFFHFVVVSSFMLSQSFFSFVLLSYC